MAKSNSVAASSGGIGLGGALFILFLALKLTGHITWSWWWVFAPLWIPVAIVLIIILLVFLGLVFAAAFK